MHVDQPAIQQWQPLADEQEANARRLVEPDHETALALADAPRSLRNYVAALQAENERLRAERDALAQENEAMRRCAIKYLGWLDIVSGPLDKALREDMANPDMCGDAAIDAAMQRTTAKEGE